ncbi:MAG: trypsin-like peptidase domain-containing protein [Bacteroidetes bacterium]|nr:trypsin-like peptidase domain-containing protein [Bacteroidota bacterium]
MINIDIFDKYINKQLSKEEEAEFKLKLSNDAEFSKAFYEHKMLIETIVSLETRKKLKKQLEEIHQSEFNNLRTLDFQQNKRGGFMRTAFIAAATAILVFGAWTFLLKPHAEQKNELSELKRDVMVLKYSKDVIVEQIAKNNSKNQKTYAPANQEASAFALNKNGYIITSLHIVEGADSVFIENTQTPRSMAKIVYTNKQLDLALLKTEASIIKQNIPFALAIGHCEIGEKVFTLGYPRNEIVYGEGSVSSLSGAYNNFVDTTLYQISIPLNQGNSGGPLFDEQGRLIGLIRGKNANADAMGFAVKSNDIASAITNFASQNNITDIHFLNSKLNIKYLKRTEQIKRISPFVFNILVYK